VELDLIYTRHNLCDIEELLEVMCAEIADSDCFYFFWAREEDISNALPGFEEFPRGFKAE
jgi:hypothetical protein